ncbi:MAG: hypothetical protein V4683_04250 [Bacteroidota bacterium]
MKNLIKFLTISILLFNVSSCKKEESAPTATKTEMLTKQPWVINQADFSSGLTLTVYKKGATSNVLDASKISLTFKSDGTITATDLDGNGVSGSWSFNADETKITLPAGLPFTEVVLLTLTENNFDVSVPSFTATVLGTTATGTLVVKFIPKA